MHHHFATQKPARDVRGRVLVGKVLSGIAVLCVFTLVGAGPVAAHGGDAEPTNYQARINSIEPRIDGLDISLRAAGTVVQVINDTGEVVTVLGYEGEPYLRLESDGVFENRRSPAAYLNVDTTGTADVPPEADADAAPEWQRITTGAVAMWHDHRTHWMASTDAPQVLEAPDTAHVVIPEWTVTLLVGEEPVVVTGELRWVPGPNPLPWFAVALVLAIGVGALGLQPSPERSLAATLAVLMAIDAIHLLGAAGASADGAADMARAVLDYGLLSLAAAVLGVVSIALLVRNSPLGLALAGLVGALLALSGGLADVADLAHSQLASAWSSTLTRALVAITLGGGAGVVLAATAALAGIRPQPAAADV